MKILVTGGAGYIGSHMVKMLFKKNYDVVIFDNLSTGFENAVKYGELIIGDLSSLTDLEKLFSSHHFDAVMHFAASSQVGQSIKDPSGYFRNNISNTLNLLDIMLKYNVRNIIFSSTAAIFGEPQYTPIDENHPTNPINPYGTSKLMVERILQDYAKAYALNSVSLRYFNACGADPEGELGENHDPETHLIPLILQAASGRRDSINIYGDDYDTPDGSCVRDYIHINDLCSAHVLALNHITINNQQGFSAFNLGNTQGYSVQQVIDIAKSIVAKDNCNINVRISEKRPGDPAVLVASHERASKILNWHPKYNNLEQIIQHAWDWEKLLTIV